MTALIDTTSTSDIRIEIGVKPQGSARDEATWHKSGCIEEVDWDTAVREVAMRLGAVRDEFGGDKITYYGGGGQGKTVPARLETVSAS